MHQDDDYNDPDDFGGTVVSVTAITYLAVIGVLGVLGCIAWRYLK